MSTDYMIYQDEQEHGPYPLEQIKPMYETGQIHSAAHCRKVGASQWESIEKLVGSSDPIKRAAQANAAAKREMVAAAEAKAAAAQRRRHVPSKLVEVAYVGAGLTLLLGLIGAVIVGWNMSLSAGVWVGASCLWVGFVLAAIGNGLDLLGRMTHEAIRTREVSEAMFESMQRSR